jgi:hypothetical protein
MKEIEINTLLRMVKNLECDKLMLLEKISLLRKKVDILEKHPKLAAGIKGETLIVDLVQGVLTSVQAEHDITLLREGIKLEVKYSNLHIPNNKSSTKRWSWLKIFGESGDKKFNKLILIGDVDPRYRNHYLDPECPYIIFDIPYEEAMPITKQTGRFRSIQLTTNPQRVRSKTSALFDRYQTTVANLKEKYGI